MSRCEKGWRVLASTGVKSTAVVDVRSSGEVMSLETWTTGLQLVSLGFIAGLILGDWLDKQDPLHWKYHVRLGEAKQMEPRTLSDDEIAEDE